MKYSCSLLILFMIITPAYLNGQVDSLIIKRTISYENYLLIRDTMTIRTWINMRNYSESLEDVVQKDNQIIDSFLTQIESDNALWNQKLDSLQEILSNRGILIEDQESRISDSFYQLKFLIFTFGILIVLLIVFIILTIVYILKFRKWKALYSEMPDENHEMTKLEIETLKEDVTKLKSELEASQGAYKAERKSKESIEEELRILLEQLDIPD